MRNGRRRRFGIKYIVRDIVAAHAHRSASTGTSPANEPRGWGVVIEYERPSFFLIFFFIFLVVAIAREIFIHK
jgi:hypothetical protein